MKKLVKDIGQIITMNEGKIPKRGDDLKKIGLIEGYDLLMENGLISEIAPVGKYCASDVDEVFSAQGLNALPGLVDSHTHSVFCGSRVGEFYERASGKDYLEILKDGGGILSTVRSVRKASERELASFSSGFMKKFIDLGTTTVEIKSGYGLTTEDEIKILKTVKKLSSEIDTVPTFLGAHAIPEEYKDRKKEYVDLIVNSMLRAVSEKKLAIFCDVFCEKGTFDSNDARRIAEAATALGLRMKFHAEQFTRSGIVELALEFSAASVDHCVEITDEDIDMLSSSETAVVFLPGTELVLNQINYAPARKVIDKNCIVALSTDFNPGSCPIQSLWTIGALAVLKLSMSFEEVLNAITVNASYSLGLHDKAGLIKEGFWADIILTEVRDFRELFYYLGSNPVRVVIKKGKVVKSEL
ncbi:imidazolonepropionase [candidate division WOR-3 bacterium]|nr:imidazolonepropionase [candidate division WOR-3 bacterium]